MRRRREANGSAANGHQEGQGVPSECGGRNGDSLKAVFVAAIALGAGAFFGLQYNEVILEKAQRFFDALEFNDPAAAFLRQVARDPKAIVNVEMGVSSEGIRGLVASRDLAKGEPIIRLPHKWLFTEASMPPQFQNFIKRCSKAKVPCDTQSVLALGILAIQREGWGAHFRHYVSMLPPKISNVLDFLPEQTAMGDARLAVTQLKQQVRATEKLLYHYPDAVWPQPSTEEIRWALDMVGTRSFYLPLDVDNLDQRMCPIMDLTNHHPDPAKMSYTEQWIDGAIVWNAARPHRRGTEICNWYGAKSNTELLLLHGFAHPANFWGPRLRLQPPLPPQAVQHLESIGCKPEFVGGHGRFASLDLRFDRPKDSEGGFVLQSEDLKCIRLSEGVRDAPEIAMLALKEGYFDRHPSPGGRPKMIVSDTTALRKIQGRCKELVERYKGDTAWLRNIKKHAAGETGNGTAEERKRSGELAKVFQENLAAAQGCVRSTESMLTMLTASKS